MNNNTPNPGKKNNGVPQKKPSASPSNTGANRPQTKNTAQTNQRPPVKQGSGPAMTGRTQKKPLNTDAHKMHFNKDIILAILALLLILALAITIVACCVKALSDAIIKNTGTTQTTVTTGTSGSTQSTVKTDPTYPPPVPGAWNEGYTTVSRNNSAMYEGDLLIVNYMHEYRFPSSINLKEMYGQPGHNSVYVLGNGMTYPSGAKSLELSRHVITPLTTMLADLKAANPTLTAERRLMVLSGYRTYEKQQTLYENETVEGLTAKPGFSEHHTGLAFDIRISLKDSPQLEYLNDTEQAWIVENCAKYGFILRYTDENKDITGILNEDWHFRYVGVAHATYMAEKDLCLEEYVDYLKENHCYGSQDPLNYAAQDKEYIIYYFPASVEKDVTNIYVPSSGYEISGNNIDGFIVTVTK